MAKVMRNRIVDTRDGLGISQVISSISFFLAFELNISNVEQEIQV